MNGHEKLRIALFRLTNKFDPRRRRPSVLKHDSACKLMELVLSHNAGTQHAIGLARSISWMHQTIGCLAVIGNKYQALGIEIKSPDRIEPVWKLGKIIGYFFPVLVLSIGAYDVLGFIKCYHDSFFARSDPFAVKGHFIAFTYAHSNLGNSAVYLNSALLNKLLTPSSRSYACIGKIFLKSHCLSFLYCS